MGRPLLIWRLVVGDIRRRPVQSALLLVMIATTTTTLTLGLALRHSTQNPFARTRAATRGPDLAFELQPRPGRALSASRSAAPLLHAPGVAGTAGPFPLAFVRIKAPAIDEPVTVEGRGPNTTQIDRPLLTAGSWVRPGGAVVEQGFADSLNLHVGDPIRLRNRTFHVVGIALTTQQAFYPACTPGLVFLTPGDTQRLALPGDPLGYVLDVKLRDPNLTGSFTSSPAANAWGTGGGVYAADMLPWQQVRHDDYQAVAIDQKALLIGSLLLAILAIASIAVVVGGRMAEQTRRVGLLKAVGGTPRLVVMVLLAENLLLGAAAAVVGLLVGWWLAPVIANPGSGLLESPPTPPLTVGTIFEVFAAALAVAALATVAPAVRDARTSTIKALDDPGRPPQRRPRLIALSSRLPVPLLLGLRLSARRSRRTMLTSASMAVAVAMVVAALTLQHQVDVKEQRNAWVGLSIGSSIGARVSHLVFLLGAVLVVLAGINAIFTAWATVIDAARPTALARALGATPRQVSAGLTAAQLVPALVAACIGIPAGLALYQLAGGHVAKTTPSAPTLIAVVAGTLLLAGVLTAVPARLAARRSVADALRTD
jgi:putative ABC transport system permease protein